MKLKSLLLTSMVALALGACSNANDAVENADAENNATFAFKITMPAGAASSRADSYTNGTSEVGTSIENALSTVSIIVDYGEGKAPLKKDFILSDFTATPTDNSVTYTLNKAFNVAAANAVKVYAVVNGTFESNNPYSGVKEATYSGDLNGLEATGGIAESGKFLMSGKAENVNIIAGKTDNQATINVDRVAAKVSEVTNAGTTFTDSKVTFTPLTYTLANLNTKTNVFENSTFAAGDSYFNSCLFQGQDALTYNYFKNMSTTSTYLMENNSTIYPTKVVYAVQVQLVGEAGTPNLYMIKDDATIYTYTTLPAIYRETWKLQDDDDYATWLKAGVSKFVSGVCYYVKDIKTTVDNSTSVPKIVRNNWYKLSINNISGIGSAVPDPKVPDAATMLSLTIQVKPWLVNINSFDL